MIMIRIAVNALPEKQLEVLQTLVSMIEPTAKESGCLSYFVLCDTEKENHFSLLAEWDTRENLDHHIKSYRFGVLLGIKTLLHEPLKIRIYTVSQSEGLEAIEAVRNKRPSY